MFFISYWVIEFSLSSRRLVTKWPQIKIQGLNGHLSPPYQCKKKNLKITVLNDVTAQGVEEEDILLILCLDKDFFDKCVAWDDLFFQQDLVNVSSILKTIWVLLEKPSQKIVKIHVPFTHESMLCNFLHYQYVETSFTSINTQWV